MLDNAITHGLVVDLFPACTSQKTPRLYETESVGKAPYKTFYENAIYRTNVQNFLCACEMDETL
jgi:hypothetical protein